MALWDALGRKSFLCAVCSKSVFLLCQDVELILDHKVGLGINDCPGAFCALSVVSWSSCFVRMWSLSWTIRLDWASMTAQVVEYSSGSLERSCSKSICSVNAC